MNGNCGVVLMTRTRAIITVEVRAFVAKALHHSKSLSGGALTAGIGPAIRRKP